MNLQKVQDFQETVWVYYQRHGRHDLPWRVPEADGSFDLYKILVSEIMLQQTQVTRVVPKFAAFLQQFPDIGALAAAPLADVLKAWSGLGYNRRAKFLWQTANATITKHGGRLPRTSAALVALPGIGPNTAGAILAYAYNQPVVFIETNIRTVFIHHCFAGVAADSRKIDDRDILDLVAGALPDNPREWYWALMDYGSHLKQTVGNVNVRSRQYAKQPTFQGSRRQIRGHVLRLLGEQSCTQTALEQAIGDERLTVVLEDLLGEGLIGKKDSRYTLYGA